MNFKKGSNILCDLDDNIKLADFGTTVNIKNKCAENNRNSNDNSCLLETFTGTLHFMSPEILKGQMYGSKVDIWALGCTIIEMFTTNPPWHNLKRMEFYSKFESKTLPPYTLPSNISAQAIDFLKLAMNDSYEKRATAKKLLQHSFIWHVV